MNMNAKPEVKSFHFELKNLDEAGKFSGYLAVFGNVDQGNDRIEKGAFARTLNAKSRFPLLWQHRMDEPVGGLSAKEDERGLLIEGELNLDVQRGKEAYALLKKGDISGLSIGYDAVKWEMQSGVRALKEIKLYEGSIVTFPMNTEATVTDVKADSGEPTPQEADPAKATPHDKAPVIIPGGTKQENKSEKEKTMELDLLKKEFEEKTNRITADLIAARESANKSEAALKELQAKGAADLEKLDKQYNERVAKLERQSVHLNAAEEKAAKMADIKKGVAGFLRQAHKGASPEERKIMSTLVGDDAGYLVAPPDYQREIIKDFSEYSPIYELARKFRTRSEVRVPRRTAAPVAAGRTESGAFTADTTRAYGLEVIPVHEMYTKYSAYFWMLEDADFDIESDMRADAGESMGLLRGTWFTTGTGIGQAEGVMTNGTVAHIAQGEAAAITNGDALKSLPYQLHDQYTVGGECVNLMRRATWATVATLKDGNGQYLISPLSQSTDRRIEGYRVVFAPDMPAVGAGTFPVVFGNFFKGYWIVERPDLAIIRGTTHTESGYYDFSFRSRIGGQVVQPLAFVKLEIAAA
jgi:HK97 family phage major capsid protein/HK97 family phage prohead protease